MEVNEKNKKNADSESEDDDYHASESSEGEDDHESESEDEETGKKRKRKTVLEETEKPKADIDSIWAELNEDTPKKQAVVSEVSKSVSTTGSPAIIASVPVPATAAVASLTKTFSTASAPSVTAKRSATGGLDALLSQMKGGKKKSNTLEQSRSQWENFKEKEGISEQLKQAAKDGFLEKQAFLQRADVRQWEYELAIKKKSSGAPR